MIRKKFGRILNCSSIGVKFGGGKKTYTYSFSKYASEFIPSDLKKLVKKNILINNLRIGVTDTNLHTKIRGKKNGLNKRVRMIPIKRMANIKEISLYINFLISENNSYQANQTISVSGGE